MKWDNSPVRPPHTVAAVLLLSPDPALLAAFYREKLAFPLVPVNLPDLEPHFGCEVGHVYISIWPSPNPVPNTARERGAIVAYYVSDVAEEVKRLESQGVPVVLPPKRTRLGMIARLEDPDGNLFELYQP